MTDRLFVRLPAQAGAELQWLWQHEGQWTGGSWATPADLQRWAAAHAQVAVTLLVPAGQECNVQLTATLRQRREAGSALVALAEDQIGEDYERLHWVLVPGEGDEVLARGVRSDWLADWLRVGRAAGLNIDGVLPEAALYTVDETSWLWLPAGDEVYLSVGPGQAALCPPEVAPDLLGGWLARQTVSTPVRLRHPQGAAPAGLPEGIQPVPVHWQGWRDLVRAQPASFWLRNPQSWLQGEFAVRQATRLDKRWLQIAACVFVVLIVQVVLDRWHAARLQAQADQLMSETESSYHAVFPLDHNTSDLGGAIARRLRGGGGGSLPQLLEQLAETAPAQPWVVEKVEYHSRGESAIDVSGGALNSLDQWAAALTSAGVAARVDGSRVDNGTAHARLTLQAGGSSR